MGASAWGGGRNPGGAFAPLRSPRKSARVRGTPPPLPGVPAARLREEAEPEPSCTPGFTPGPRGAAPAPLESQGDPPRPSRNPGAGGSQRSQEGSARALRGGRRGHRTTRSAAPENLLPKLSLAPGVGGPWNEDPPLGDPAQGGVLLCLDKKGGAAASETCLGGPAWVS